MHPCRLTDVFGVHCTRTKNYNVSHFINIIDSKLINLLSRASLFHLANIVNDVNNLVVISTLNLSKKKNQYFEAIAREGE